ncbi:UNVERIFIED_CONTAM: hypothetical protein NCL1_36317 [Trichonephila clavipes]
MSLYVRRLCRKVFAIASPRKARAPLHFLEIEGFGQRPTQLAPRGRRYTKHFWSILSINTVSPKKHQHDYAWLTVSSRFPSRMLPREWPRQKDSLR